MYTDISSLEKQLAQYGYTVNLDLANEIVIEKDGVFAEYDELPSNVKIIIDNFGKSLEMTPISTPAKISSLKFNDRKIILSENGKGKPVAKYFKFITSGPNKGTYKFQEGFYFTDEKGREAWIKEVINRVKNQAADKLATENAKKEIRANMVNPFKVGEIYYNSWGYEQTNINFYEVIEVKAKSVMIQEIGGTQIESEGLSSMSCMLIPDPTNRLGQPELKNVQFYLQSDNTPQFYIKAESGSICKYDKGDRGVYCSWYA